MLYIVESEMVKFVICLHWVCKFRLSAELVLILRAILENKYKLSFNLKLGLIKNKIRSSTHVLKSLLCASADLEYLWG